MSRAYVSTMSHETPAVRELWSNCCKTFIICVLFICNFRKWNTELKDGKCHRYYNRNQYSALVLKTCVWPIIKLLQFVFTVYTVMYICVCTVVENW